MKISIVALLMVLVACTAEDRRHVSLQQRTAKLQDKLKELVTRRARQAMLSVKNAEYSLRRDVHELIQSLESRINSSVATAIEDINVMRNETPLECFAKATKELALAQEAALLNLVSCEHWSQAYQDIKQVDDLAQPIIDDILKDAKIIIKGVGDCFPQPIFKQWACVLRYVSKELTNFHHQWPDVKNFIIVTEKLALDVENQITKCLNEPTQVDLDKAIQRALDNFSSCFVHSSMDSFDNHSYQ